MSKKYSPLKVKEIKNSFLKGKKLYIKLCNSSGWYLKKINSIDILENALVRNVIIVSENFVKNTIINK